MFAIPAAAAAFPVQYDAFSVVVTDLSGFHSEDYKIFLSQIAFEERYIKGSYQALYHGRPVDTRHFHVRVLLTLRYGRSLLPPPQIRKDRPVLDILSHGMMNITWQFQFSQSPELKQLPYFAEYGTDTNEFKFVPTISASGGHDSTLRLRVVLLHPEEDMVLCCGDSEPFTIMTRSLPADSRWGGTLADWGFTPIPAHQAQLDQWLSVNKKDKESLQSDVYDESESDLRNEQVILPDGTA